MSNESLEPDQKPDIGSDMSADDQELLHHWRDSLILLDVRYHDKRLVKLAAQAMVDADFRMSLVQDGNRYVHAKSSPDDVTIKFLANTADLLHVVLPPPAGDITNRPPALREALTSRTAEVSSFFQDEWNIADLGTKDPNVIGNGLST